MMPTAPNNNDKQNSFKIPNFVTNLNSSDVLFGRGVPIFSYVGNVQFRQLVLERKDRYSHTSRRHVKNDLAQEIVSIVHSRNGRFLREICDSYEELELGVPNAVKAWAIVDKKKVLQKVKQAMREPECTKRTQDTTPNTPTKNKDEYSRSKNKIKILLEVDNVNSNVMENNFSETKTDSLSESNLGHPAKVPISSLKKNEESIDFISNPLENAKLTIQEKYRLVPVSTPMNRQQILISQLSQKYPARLTHSSNFPHFWQESLQSISNRSNFTQNLSQIRYPLLNYATNQNNIFEISILTNLLSAEFQNNCRPVNNCVTNLLQGSLASKKSEHQGVDQNQNQLSIESYLATQNRNLNTQTQLFPGISDIRQIKELYSQKRDATKIFTEPKSHINSAKISYDTLNNNSLNVRKALLQDEEHTKSHFSMMKQDSIITHSSRGSPSHANYYQSEGFQGQIQNDESNFSVTRLPDLDLEDMSPIFLVSELCSPSEFQQQPLKKIKEDRE